MEKKTERSIRRLFIDGAADLGDAIQCLQYKKDGLGVECKKAVEVIIDELGVPEHGTSPVSATPGGYSALRERVIDLLMNDVTVVSSTEEVVIPLEKRNELLDDLLDCDRDASAE